jgi:metallo-beta-lactamase class B
MKMLAALVCALTVAATATSAQTIGELLKTLTAHWNAPAEPLTIVGNVHYVGTAGLSSFLITSSQGHILIDTGLPEATPQIVASIEKLGFKATDIKYLLNTHAHLDHTGGLAELKRMTGAQLVSSAGDKPLLEGGYYPGRETVEELKFPPVKVDRVIGEGDSVTVGAVTLTARMTPGHSPGCTTWMTSVKDGNAEHNVVFFCSATVALNRLVGNPTHLGIVEDYRRTFKTVRDIKADVFLAPHPEMFGMKEKQEQLRAGAANPFIKPGEFSAYTDKMEKAFEADLAKQMAALEPKKN